MKRIQSACICQTLHFQLKEDVPHNLAAQQVKEELEHYKRILEKNRTQYKIISEEMQEDQSIIVKVKKQYNSSPVGNYLD